MAAHDIRHQLDFLAILEVGTTLYRPLALHIMSPTFPVPVFVEPP
jgi:hypothetical protein